MSEGERRLAAIMFMDEHWKELVKYAIKLAKAKRGQARFVILDGSAAEGKDARYSDYDIAVVKKGTSGPAGSVGDLYLPPGMFKGRLVSGWVLDDRSFERYFIGTDDEEFVWRRRQLQKAKLLYGNQKDFDRAMRPALARRWNKKRQLAVVKPAYVTMVEYLGKMLNKADKGPSPEFFQDGYVVASKAAILVAALNELDWDSNGRMYRQVLSEAKVRPPNFEEDFVVASGLGERPRDTSAVIAASRRLVNWARNHVIDSFGRGNPEDEGFWRLVRDMRF